MANAVQQAWGVFSRQRLAILWFALFSINALCTAILGALSGAEWTELHLQARFLIVVSILASWTNTIAALFKNLVQPPAGNSGTVAPFERPPS